MKKKVIVLGLVVLLFWGVTYVYAQGPGSDPGHRGMHSQECRGPGKGPSLTPEQKAKFNELRQKFNEETAQLRGSMLTKRLELQSLWSNPKAEAKAIMDKEKELRDLQNQMRDKIIQNKLEARKLLTPEQITESGAGGARGFGPGTGGGMGPGMGHGMHRGMGMGN